MTMRDYAEMNGLSHKTVSSRMIARGIKLDDFVPDSPFKERLSKKGMYPLDYLTKKIGHLVYEVTR